MFSAKSGLLVGAVTLVSQAAAHGIVQGIVADGVYYSGYSPSFQYQQTQPVVPGWSIPEDKDTGYVSDYSSPDMICHKGATPGQTYAKVAAGGKITLQWTDWPESHHGPVMDYLANCNGECTDVDKTELLFNKIDEAGLNSGDPAPGNWASDDLIANNNSWTVTIPSFVAAGKYVLRHETIALHSANNPGGAQNYPQCINIEITESSGTNSLSGGTKGTELYTSNDPGIYVNIYYPPLKNYTIPGPPLIDGASSDSQPTNSTPTTSSSSSSTTDARDNNVSTSTITEDTTLTTFKTVTAKPSSTEKAGYGYGSGPEDDSDGSDSTSQWVAVTDAPSPPNQVPSSTFTTTTTTTTTASFTTTVTHAPEESHLPPKDGPAPPKDGPSPPLGSGKPRKFVCYEVEE